MTVFMKTIFNSLSQTNHVRDFPVVPLENHRLHWFAGIKSAGPRQYHVFKRNVLNLNHAVSAVWNLD